MGTRGFSSAEARWLDTPSDRELNFYERNELLHELKMKIEAEYDDYLFYKGTDEEYTVEEFNDLLGELCLEYAEYGLVTHYLYSDYKLEEE